VPITTPNEFLLPALHSDGGRNISGYSDEDLDRLIELQAVTHNPEHRAELIREIERRALAAAVRLTPAARHDVWAVWPHVQGFYPQSVGYEYDFWTKVWMR
jgi:ABC-type oligopeptide transport system substrate-binding subunit